MNNENQNENQGDINRAIGRLEGKIDVGFENITNRLDKINGTNEKQEIRISKIENKISTSDGKIAGIAFIISFVVSIIGIVWGYFNR